MTHTAWQVLLLVLGAACFAAAAFIPESPPFAPYRLRVVACGLLLWILVPILLAAGAL